MKLGFIGVGKIATSVVEGIFKAKINIKEILGYVSRGEMIHIDNLVYQAE